jgi:hypothetical protein
MIEVMISLALLKLKALFGNPFCVCTIQCDYTVQLDKFDHISLKNTSQARKRRFYP